MAGGSGTRLWPLSRPEYPKQLMKLDGNEHSLLQDTYDRASKLSSTVYIITTQQHAPSVQEQLPELTKDTLLIEPAGRGTASCVTAVLAHLKGRHDPDEPIIFMHADHYIRNAGGFIHSFMIA